MDDLLKVKSIVLEIACNLNAEDYLSFRSVNRLVYYHHLNGPADEAVWKKKLIAMGLKEGQGTEATKETNNIISFDDDYDRNDSATIFDFIRTFTKKDARSTYIKFYRCFQPYCRKLYHSNFTNFFPEKYDEDPLVQVKIFNYISRYNKSNTNDMDQYDRIDQNLKILKEIFVNSVLQEMETNYAANNYETVGKFIQVLLQCHEETNAVEFFRSKSDPSTEIKASQTVFEEDGALNHKTFENALNSIRDYLNGKIEMVDILFGDRYPVILQFIETFIQENVLDFFNQLFEANDSRLRYMPTIYFFFIQKLCTELKNSKNAGPSFHQIVRDFLNMYLEPRIVEYLELQPREFTKQTSLKFQHYEEEVASREKETNEQIYNSLKDQSKKKNNMSDDKNDFLSAFTKMLRIPNSETQKKQEQLQLAYNLNLITNNLQNIKSLVSLDLSCEIIQDAQSRTEEMYKFHLVENVLEIVKSKCQEIFKSLIDQLGNHHIKPGFEKATDLLQKYNSNDVERVELKLEGFETKVEPLVQFTELINIGDIILQMTSIFYKNELIHNNIINKNRDFLNDVVQAKKNFETMLDDFVAEGLNIGINKLMDEVEFVFNTTQMPEDFNPVEKLGQREIKPTQCAIKVVELLSNHCFLLTGATDKGTIDVYQQEIAERFFNEVVKHVKKSLISTDGAIFLICDLNYYYDFIAYKLRQKRVVPLFIALKNVGQLYIISGKDSKELGKMICDVNRFKGIFSQEEIYEFVERRSDWVRVRRDVEKVMYGLGLKDCVVM
ncbi:RCY1 (YJL204C) [Zygosaccharomyces parabailii]|nr:RCY1 (YJL204C) [Zygosaccharomyces parabailii]CDH08685.1 related to Recyclin-1 [Zygosaccharomyces bailii ISA1307]